MAVFAVQAPLSTLLSRNKLKASDVDAVELLGGGSRVPKLQAALSEALGGRWVRLDLLITTADCVIFIGIGGRAAVCEYHLTAAERMMVAGACIFALMPTRVWHYAGTSHCCPPPPAAAAAAFALHLHACRHLDRHLDADEAVVLGAGLFAANLSSSFRLRVSLPASLSDPKLGCVA